MKKLCALLLGILTLLCCVTAHGKEDAITEDMLLTVTIGGVDYRLGVTTPADLAKDGWAYEVEADGIYSFLVPDYESYFYAETDGGEADDPIIWLNLMWADGLDVVYCGFAGENDESALWDWLNKALGAEADEEGILYAYYPVGEKLLVIETEGIRVCLSLIPAVNEETMAE